MPRNSAAPSKGFFIVVVCGYGGLGTAIELRRKGFDVEVFEAAKKLTTQVGDVIRISPSASNLLLESPLPTAEEGFPELYCNRGEVQRVLYEHAISLGIKFRFGARITKYHEDDEGAGVYVGETLFKADGVIAADGIHSIARTVVTEREDKPVSSGYAIYRSWFPLDVLKDDPKTSHYVTSGENSFHVWLGRDIHCMIVTNQNLNGCVVFCTHKDTKESQESWNVPGNVQEEMELIEGWDKTLRTIIKKIPADRLIDWKLMWRDQARKWASDKGRIVLLGDAAHPHLPSSGTGAVQAFEDTTTIAAALDIIGKGNVPLAFRVFEKRERTSLTMRLGWETRHRWHRTDVEAIRKNPEIIKMPQPKWMIGHDAEKYAYEKIEEAARSVQEKTPFKSTNTYEGHVHEEWTIETTIELETDEKSFEYRVKGQ
ncbi:FAD/NAD(P)-binding domain-containing protein [Corynespora cassiicola Philippines]|uniref:FAD/NAD(P)-binding domain-containing protein n=1 Tax=Corynespora cassiicola Philippines TaxID=1448308 RepID=A0A2T2N7A9_CORCC|nr:FAD/NAD(P)-binding domain-containing protein [Corynespora cassiicola Philippines]